MQKLPSRDKDYKDSVMQDIYNEMSSSDEEQDESQDRSALNSEARKVLEEELYSDEVKIVDEIEPA